MKRLASLAIIAQIFCVTQLFAQVDETPFNLEPVAAFSELKWAGWDPDGDNGKPSPLRPILLTNAGDGSKRIFVPQQQGIVHSFKSNSAETSIFLDISSRVFYYDKENEEGFLGMTFHPKFKTNGEFFVYYTPKDKAPKDAEKDRQHITVVSRFRVSKDDPNKADPDSEEVILSISHPYWNHKGGTICFGPDGMLYIAVGDGGAGADPHGNGQNMQTLLAKILRIDVDQKDPGLNYGIPKDNPFLDLKSRRFVIARPEIYAYGLRNVWRMSFDRQTGLLWAADVGQSLWEEIDIIEKGGNYGWNLREGRHTFAPNSTSNGSGFIEPIWEYDHEAGKSITGGNVYRGKKLPELVGHYLYGDYLTRRIWALKYDEQKKIVVANRPIPHSIDSLLIVSFGEDEDGETYFTTITSSGKGIYSFQRKE